MGAQEASSSNRNEMKDDFSFYFMCAACDDSVYSVLDGGDGCRWTVGTMEESSGESRS